MFKKYHKQDKDFDHNSSNITFRTIKVLTEVSTHYMGCID